MWINPLSLLARIVLWFVAVTILIGVLLTPAPWRTTTLVFSAAEMARIAWTSGRLVHS